jgi:hypothetical protein
MTKARDLGDVVSNAAWTTWTPTLSDVTVGNGTVSAAYRQIGKTVFWEFRLVFGSTTSITGGNSFLNLPVTGKRVVSKSMVGQMIDANGSIFPSIGYWIGESGFYLGVINASGTYGTLSQITSSVPFNWTTSDSITYSGVYEVA